MTIFTGLIQRRGSICSLAVKICTWMRWDALHVRCISSQSNNGRETKLCYHFLKACEVHPLFHFGQPQRKEWFRICRGCWLWLQLSSASHRFPHCSCTHSHGERSSLDDSSYSQRRRNSVTWLPLLGFPSHKLQIYITITFSITPLKAILNKEQN